MAEARAMFFLGRPGRESSNDSKIVKGECLVKAGFVV